MEPQLRRRRRRRHPAVTHTVIMCPLEHDSIFDSDPLEIGVAIATSRYNDVVVVLVVHSRTVKLHLSAQ